eukprot:g1232.t1
MVSGNTVVILCAAVGLKLLLIPSYHSTDFEVHRNWLAITHSLPVSQWYYADHSEWTLDYPPFFAWFEWLLSQFASLCDERMLAVHNLRHATSPTIYFQRGTVMVTELVLLTAVPALCRTLHGTRSTRSTPTTGAVTASQPATAALALTALSPGLIYVDHVHFQYNGFLLGVLLWATERLYAVGHSEGQKAGQANRLLAAVLFAALVMMKHLFVYLGPPFAVALLRLYCCHDGDGDTGSAGSAIQKKRSKSTEQSLRFSLSSFITLAATALVVIAIALLPVLVALPNGSLTRVDLSGNTTTIDGAAYNAAAAAAASGDTVALLRANGVQLFKRLFPFGRGLCHAYWAPNVWALYAGADKAFVLLRRLRGASTTGDTEFSGPSMTGGLVQQASFSMLPQISAGTCLLLAILSMIPSLWALWSRGRPPARRFVAVLVHCGMASFMLGYHVHEKAILVPLVPLAVLVVGKHEQQVSDTGFLALARRLFLVMGTTGTFALFPLLFGPVECPTKVLLLVAYFAACTAYMRAGRVLSKLEQLYLWGCVALFLYTIVLHGVIFGTRLPFLPLMVMSLYCAVGLVWSWWLSFRLVWAA